MLAGAGGSGLTYSLMRERGAPPPPVPALAPPAADPRPTAASPREEDRANVPNGATTAGTPEGAIAASPPGASTVPEGSVTTVARRININTATQAELELLPDIGPATARRIIAYRASHGAFKTIDDLDKVEGIGAKTLDKVRGLVRVE